MTLRESGTVQKFKFSRNIPTSKNLSGHQPRKTDCDYKTWLSGKIAQKQNNEATGGLNTNKTR